MARAKGAGEKVGQYAKNGETTKDGQCPPADVSEILRPGGDQQTGENERYAGECRQEQAGDAQEGQRGAEEQEGKG